MIRKNCNKNFDNNINQFLEIDSNENEEIQQCYIGENHEFIKTNQGNYFAVGENTFG